MWRITLSLANHNIHLMIKRRSRIKIGMRGKDVKRAELYQYVVVEHQEGEQLEVVWVTSNGYVLGLLCRTL